jgi:hypothetical protein
MLRPLFGHPDLLLIVRGVIVPWEPNFTPLSPAEAPAHRQEPCLFVMADVCVSIKAVADLSRSV